MRTRFPSFGPQWTRVVAGKYGLGLATALMLALAGVVAVSAAVSGAIFTTTATGSTVNGNIYAAKEDVYLSGGPLSSCTSAALPNGDYYFMVTDPSGDVLLSEDSVADRQFSVASGVITYVVGATPHVTSTGSCGETIQLLPYFDTTNQGGEYKLWVTPVGQYSLANFPNTHGFNPAESKTDNFKVRCPNGCEETPPLPAVYGVKFYDGNADGVQNNGELGIAGWKIDLHSLVQTFTSTTGQYSFLNVLAGQYTVTEIFPPAAPWWVATTPVSGNVTVNEGDDLVAGPNFGNVCVGGGGGLTLGFWSNKNGQALVGSNDLSTLVALNLRNGNGTHFNPATYGALKNWLLSATATNMAYMLSAQLAAMTLNTTNGAPFVGPNSLIYAPGTDSANSAGFATVANVMAEANTSLGLYGMTTVAGTLRAHQEALKNALDRANNNRNFVLPTQSLCPAFTTPY